MKNQITTTVALLVFTLSGSAFASTQVSLDGSWTLVERVCTNGQAPKDRFQLGRDTVQITISGRRFESVQLIDNEVYRSRGAFSIEGRQLIMQKPNEPGNKSLFTVSSNGELMLLSAGFGKGGSCAEGEGLMTVLQRK